MEERARINVKNIISIIILLIVIIIGAVIYSKYNYNNFTKNVREEGKTSFSRDANIKYSDMKSYKIENKEYNDAMFCQNVSVKANTPYKITCKVKTQDVENEEKSYISGAQISIKGTTECSKSVTGTSDWTELTFMFNSKNRTNVDIGFRLGGYQERSKGTAWFSDFKMEEGTLDTDKKWNVVCFMIQNIDVNVNLNGKPTHVKLKMSDTDMSDIESTINRIPNTISKMSNNNIQMDFDVIKITNPLTSISYDEENEYYIDPKDVKDLIQEYLDKKEYDYIYIATRLGKLNEDKNALVHDWIGLGGMDYYEVGFSNIRLPNNSNSYIYKYDERVNTFPEEVFIHEFLHTLERNEKEYGNNNVANLHDYEKYNYKREDIIGLKKWYTVYIQNSIKNSKGEKVGLSQEIHLEKPIHESNFKYSYELNELKEPKNFIEEMNCLIKRVKQLFQR